MTKKQIANFYDRSSEFRLFEKILEPGRKNTSPSKKIINFFGISGSGKTLLIDRLEEQYGKERICYLSREQDAMSLPLLSEQEFLESLIARVGEGATQFLPDNNENHPEEAAKHWEWLLSRFDEQEKKSLLLLIDNYDTWPANMQKVFEHDILGKTAKHKCALTVLTSQAKISFRYKPPLSFHTDFQELNTFTNEVIKKEYKEYVPIVPYIIRATGGLPLCVEQLIKQLHEQNITTVDEFQQYERNFVEQNYEAVIKDRILVGLEPELMETLCVLSIPRRFNISIMSRLLSHFLPNQYQGFTNIDYLELIDDLGSFAPWIPERNGYSIPKSIRQMIMYYMKLFKSEADNFGFPQINAEMLQIYQEHGDTSLSEVQSFVESLYHTFVPLYVQEDKAPTTERISREFSEKMQHACSEYITTRNPSENDFNAVKEILGSDDELNSYITEDTQNFMEQKLKLLI